MSLIKRRELEKNTTKERALWGPTPLMLRALYREGAPEVQDHVPMDLELVRKMDPKKGMEQIVAMGPLERSKKQSRKIWEDFKNFQKKNREKAGQMSLAETVAWWLQENLRNPKIKRVTTLSQKARMLQGLIPHVPFMKDPFLLAYFKGLGRIQPTAARAMDHASSHQCSIFLRAAKDCWTTVATLLLVKGAARLSDIRAWIGGKGVLKSHSKGNLELHLDVRKTDQAGAAPMAHIVGPIKVEAKVFDGLIAQKNLWQRNPLKESPYNPTTFLKQIQNMKKSAGVFSMIHFRRARARTAAKITTTDNVAELLGHRKGSTSTKRYIQDLDAQERSRRLLMTR